MHATHRHTQSVVATVWDPHGRTAWDPSHIKRWLKPCEWMRWLRVRAL